MVANISNLLRIHGFGDLADNLIYNIGRRDPFASGLIIDEDAVTQHKGCHITNVLARHGRLAVQYGQRFGAE